MANKESLIKALNAHYELDVFIKNVLRPVFDSRMEIYSKPQKRQLSESDKRIVKSIDQYGHVALENGQVLMLHEVVLAPNVKPNQAKVGMASILKKHIPGLNAELVNFINPSKPENWRLSLIARHKSLNTDGTIKDKDTSLSRFSYVLGPSESCRTAGERLTQVAIKQEFNVDTLINAFEVDILSKEFFNEYKYTHYNAFVRHISGIEIKKSGKGKPDVFAEVSKPQATYKSSFRSDPKKVRDFVKRMLGRVLFLYFVQKKGWLEIQKEAKWQADHNFLQNLFKECPDKGNFYSVYLRKLFFETLNSVRHNDEAEFIKGKLCRIPFLNGGLFENDEPETDWVIFPPELFEKLFEFLNRFNFTIDEDGPKDHTVAVDPEMLGHIFENLLEDNKDKGAFYTPKEIVHFMCQGSLVEYLCTYIERATTNGSKKIELDSMRKGVEQFIENHLAEQILKYDKLILTALRDVKICDPAIGSGAFPMGLLHEIFQAVEYLHTITPDTVEEVWGLKGWEPSKVKLDIIENSIYGVDIEKGAVDIARLRFWLSLVVDEEKPTPLPNLDYKIVEGNSLLSKFDKEVVNIDWSNRDLPSIVKKEKELIEKSFDELIKKEKLVFEGDKSKAKLQVQIRNLKLEILSNQIKINRIRFEEGNKQTGSLFGPTKEEKIKSLKIKEALAVLMRMLAKIEVLKKNQEPLRYFDWKLDFPDVLNDQVSKVPGFDIVIGNPPYVQLQKMGEEANLLQKAGYNTFIRTGDIYCLFYERGHQILKEKGVLTFITSNKWMRASYGEAVRKYFIKECNPLKLIDFAGYQVFENATVDTNILISERAPFEGKLATCSLGDDLDDLSYLSDYFRRKHRVGEFGFESWVLLNQMDLSIRQKIMQKGVQLKDWNVKINYGIKTGLNDAFIINEDKRGELIEKCPESEGIIRPILRGRDIEKFKPNWAGLYLIHIPWHFPLHKDNSVVGGSLKAEKEFKRQYPAIYDHLSNYKKELTNRNVAETGIRYEWYALQRWGANYMDDFFKHKMYPNMTKYMPFIFDTEGYFINDKGFIITGEGIAFLTAFLNSSLFKFCFRENFPELQGGTRELRKVFLDKIPVIQVSNKVDQDFKKMVVEIQTLKRKGVPTIDLEKKLDSMIFDLYDLTNEERTSIGFIEIT